MTQVDTNGSQTASPAAPQPAAAAQPAAVIYPAQQQPASQPMPAAPTAPAQAPQQKQQDGGDGRPFDPDLLKRTLERYPEAREMLKDMLGVNAMQKTILDMSIREARLYAMAKLGFTEEQAAAIPGATAQEIINNAQFAGQFKATGAGGATHPANNQPANAGQPSQQYAAPQPAPQINAQVPTQFVSQPSGPMTKDQILEEYKRMTTQR